MRSRSERTYGARLGNAQTLLTTLQSAGDYQALSAELSLEGLETLITKIRRGNNDLAANRQSYSLAVDDRQGVFDKQPDSIAKALSPINATVKACFGKQSKEASDVATLIVKMRGQKKMRAAAKPDEESVSQSYRSYNSIAQFLADMIQKLGQLHGYTSQNANASIDSLNSLLARALDANQLTVQTFTAMKQVHASVLQHYEDLAVMCSRIKEAVKAQYGTQSSIYRAIKGLKI